MAKTNMANVRIRVDEWRRNYGWLFDSAVALVALNVLNHFGQAAEGTIWQLNAVLLLTAIAQQPRVSRWVRGGDDPSTAIVWRPTALGVALTATAIYLTGWGPLLGIGFVVLASGLLHTAGSRCWRPTLVLSCIAAACGQVGIALGWIHTYLPPSGAQVMGTLGTVGAALTIRLLGLTTEEREGETAERSRVEHALRESETMARRNEDRFRTLVQASHDVVSVTDKSGRITYVSGAVEHVMGYLIDDYPDVAGLDLVHPDDLPAGTAMIEALWRGADEYRTELRFRHADGSWRWHEVLARNLLDNAAVQGIVFNHRDITERKHYQERLAYDASHDALTGLANRTAFLETLEAMCSGAGPGPGAVLYADLDGFKRINDELGHEVGDALLIATARVLRECVLGADVVARLGGDEFAVVLNDIHTADNAVAVAARVVERLLEPVLVGGHLIRAHASIGVAMCVPGETAAAEAIRHADLAMYRAKRDKQGWQLYLDGMQDHRSTVVALEEDLRHALANDQLQVFYQPIIDLETEQIIGMEALVRWQHPSRGWLAPTTFIPLAEETGLIGQLGAMVLLAACGQLRRWQRRLPDGPRLTLSVNLSPRQLERQTLVAEVRQILDATGVDPRDLVLELTENALVDDTVVVPQLRALSDLGIRIALDDFGTGYSSLRYLTTLPVDVLKIDRGFIESLDGTPEGAAVADAVLRLGQVLQLDVIAEGVETAAQAAELKLRGCRTAQGFHFARPGDASTMDTLVDRLSASSAVRGCV